MIYIIYNNTTKQIEGVYLDPLAADSMMRNLNLYYKDKFCFSLKTIETPRNRPTALQWKRIHEIEIKTLKKFTGITYDAAKKFINENT